MPNKLLLPELFDELKKICRMDEFDWRLTCAYALEWKLSIADSLLDLHYSDEFTIANALANAHSMAFVSGVLLECDFTGIDIDAFDDLVAVGAVPLLGNRLAICNPYDDLRGSLGNKLCEREMVVTERTPLFETLRKQSLLNWSYESSHE